jgi:hypothetical protein
LNDFGYPYDRKLYGRSFLNCYQRQSLVMLAEHRQGLPYLFHKCLLSTDDILAQMVLQQRPKYGFESSFFSPGDLARIGISGLDVAADTYPEAKQLALAAIEATGYAILVVDVFYLRHCPEYRNEHVVHTITLKDWDPRSGEWSVVDDNPASVLCRYTYPEDVVAASFENNTLRRVRSFSCHDFDEEAAAKEAAQEFATALAGHQDSRALFNRAADILACEWLSPSNLASSLHNAFSLYHGSRALLREYVTRRTGDPAVSTAFGRATDRATEIQGALLVGRATGMVDVAWLTRACTALADADRELLELLRTTDNERSHTRGTGQPGR